MWNFTNHVLIVITFIGSSYSSAILFTVSPPLESNLSSKFLPSFLLWTQYVNVDTVSPSEKKKRKLHLKNLQKKEMK